MKCKTDPDKCPICRKGQLGKHKLARPIVFCPICRTKPITEQPRTKLGILTETWWVCGHCKAEFDLGLLKESAKLVRYEQDPFGIAAKYSGQSLPLNFWVGNSPQCNLTRKCSTCGAVFYEFHDSSMAIAQSPIDPYGIAAQTLGRCMPRETWAGLAQNLAPNVGNAYCPGCRAEFDFNQGGQTLKLLSCNAVQPDWATNLKGHAVSLSMWSILSEGKRSSHPGRLCKRCSTELDSEETGLRLVQSTARTLCQNVGAVLSFSDWQRLGAGVLTAAQENALREELLNLQVLKRQEELTCNKREEERRVGLYAELVSLVKRSVLAGFIPVPSGNERLPLDKNEAVCWNSPAGRLKQRSRQGQSYWKPDDNGTLFVTTQRVVFATPDAKRWQRPLSKMHTARVEYLGAGRDVPVLVMGFDGLQKPVAFYFWEVDGERHDRRPPLLCHAGCGRFGRHAPVAVANGVRREKHGLAFLQAVR